MRVLVTGAKGMLGQDLVSVLMERGHEPISTDLAELDITDPVSVAQLPTGFFGQVDWVVNCAAYTAVDKAEEHIQLAHEINALGPGYLASSCRLTGTKLLHLSTDFVFDGESDTPYDEEAPTHPLGVYGRSKRQGEINAIESNPNTIVVRTAWLYGPLGASFPRTMIRAHEAGKKLRVVSDQKGNPTYTWDLAEVLAQLIERNAFPGVYHATGPDTMSWHEFATETLRTWTGHEIDVEPIPSKEWPTPASRPANSALSCGKLLSLGIEPMRPVEVALKEFCHRLRTVDG